MTSTHDIVGMMSRGWNQPPQGCVMAPKDTVARAAIWRGDPKEPQEVWADPLPDHHIFAFSDASVKADTFFDGKLVYGGLRARGSVHLVPAGVRPRAVLSSRYAALHVYLPVATIRSVTEELVRTRPSGIELVDPALAKDVPLGRLSEQILAEMRSAEPLSRLRVDLLTQDLAIQLVRRWSNVEMRRSPRRGGLAPWQIKRVTEYLEADLARTVTLADLSAIAGLSSCHFCRAFKQSLGLAPHQWLRTRRMEKARELLETTELPMIEVGALVGLESPSGFATAFRRHVGASPSAYRRDRRS